MPYKIGSFNLHNAGQNTKEEKLKMIAHIIQSEQFDLVALQEVFCNFAQSRNTISYDDYSEDNSDKYPPLSGIIKNLGSKWKGFFTAPPQSRDAKEGYAFLWNTDKFDLPVNTIGRKFYPRIINNYTWIDSTQKRQLIRNPLYGRFIVKDGQYLELRIINTHIRFSKDAGKNSDNQDEQNELSLSDVKMRLEEFDVITKMIYPQVADKIYGTYEDFASRPSYTIIVGDYNLNLNRNWTKSPYLTGREEFETGRFRIRKMKTVQEGLTTLKRIPEGKEEEWNKQQKWSNNYDHATYDANYFSNKGMSVSVHKVDAVRKYGKTEEPFVYYRKNISDHIPIRVELDTKTLSINNTKSFYTNVNS